MSKPNEGSVGRKSVLRQNLMSYFYKVHHGEMLPIDAIEKIEAEVSQLALSGHEAGRRKGAEEMRDWMVLAGVTIDGVDYLKLDDVFERAEEFLATFSQPNTKEEE